MVGASVQSQGGENKKMNPTHRLFYVPYAHGVRKEVRLRYPSLKHHLNYGMSSSLKRLFHTAKI